MFVFRKKDGPKPRCLGGNVGHVKGPRDTFCFHSWGAQGSSIEGLKDMVLRRPLKPSSRSVELRWDGTFWGRCSSPWLQFTSSFLMFLVSWHLLQPNACFPWRKHLKTNLIMDDFGIILWYKWIDITGTLKPQWIEFQVFGLGIVSSLYVQLPVSVAPALAQAPRALFYRIRENTDEVKGIFIGMYVDVGSEVQ